MFKTIKAKLGNMRKEKEFVVYPQGNNQNQITIQADNRICSFDKTTGQGLLSTKGSYFCHLLKQMGAIEVSVPQNIIDQCVAQQPKKGDEIAPGIVAG
jgi:hypothetical protein